MDVFVTSSCSGKVRFETFDHASGVAAARRHGKFKGPRSVYRCKVCRGFHISGNTTYRRRRMK